MDIYLITLRLYLCYKIIEFLPIFQNPLKRALAFKTEGNKYFKSGKYAEAIKCYDSAIEICPTDKKLDLSTFYQNRAAAYEQLVKKTFRLLVTQLDHTL